MKAKNQKSKTITTFDEHLDNRYGQVGTANYWIVLPLVFCENRNLEVMKSALIDDLGYGKQTRYNFC